MLPPAKSRLIVRAAQRGDRRRARRRVPARGVPDRLGHAVQHERQRGDRQPRDRARRRHDRLEDAGPSQRPRQPRASRRTTSSRRRCMSRRSRRSTHACSRRSARLRDTLDRQVARVCRHRDVGRTHLQDATPITLGQVIVGLGRAARRRAPRRSSPARRGCTARDRRHRGRHRAERARGFGDARRGASSRTQPGKPFVSAPNKFAALSAHDALVNVSAALRTLARRLMKIANDVRLHASGPRGGIAELDPRERAGLVDHAGQGQPDAVRGADDGRRARLRQRPRGGVRGLAGQLPAQRLQAGDPARRARVDRPARRRLPLVRRALRAGHRAQPRRIASTSSAR